MSDNQNMTVILVVSFSLGFLMGAVMTLFLAPMSGRELRGKVGEEAQADWQRATDQLNQTREDMRQQMEHMRQQIETYDQRVREQISTQLSQLQVKLDKQAEA